MRAATVAATLFATHAAAQIRAIVPHAPARDFGYFVGDVFQACATIEVAPGTVLDTRSLPPSGAVSASIDLRDVAVSDEAVAGGRRLTICATYQNFLAPASVSRIDVPGYDIVFVHSGTRDMARVPGFSIAVSPFRHDLQPVLDPAAMRADHPMMSEESWPARRDVALGAGLVALAGLLLMSDWIPPRLSRRPRPFAEAARMMAAAGPGEDSARAAFLTLHRAFDSALGRRMLARDVGALLERCPGFAKYRAEIESFFDASQAMFFGDTAATMLTPRDAAALCRKLARLERRL